MTDQHRRILIPMSLDIAASARKEAIETAATQAGAYHIDWDSIREVTLADPDLSNEFKGQLRFFTATIHRRP